MCLMDDKNLSVIVGNILGICDVKVRTPAMLDDLRKYVTDLEKDILEGRL